MPVAELAAHGQITFLGFPAVLFGDDVIDHEEEFGEFLAQPAVFTSAARPFADEPFKSGLHRPRPRWLCVLVKSAPWI